MADNARTGFQRWALVAILVLAFGLRIYRLGAGSLWYDETVSVHLAGKSLPALVAHTAGDIHPPGYYLLLHGWIHLAGNSGFSVAFPSLFFGLLLVALAYWLGTLVFGSRAGLLAAFLVTISPYNIWYSQEVRMYTLGAALGMVVLGLVIRLLATPTSHRFAPSGGWSNLTLAAYVVCAVLGLWTLYYFAFLLAAVNLMVGLWWLSARARVGWRWLARWALAQAAVLLLYLPWIPVAWRQVTQPPVPPWRGFTALGDLLVETWSALCLGQPAKLAQSWPVLILFALLFVLGLFSKRLIPRLTGRCPDGGFWPWLLAGYVFLPVLLIYLASFLSPLYHVRYAFTYSTPFYIIVGAGLAWLVQRCRPAAGLGLAAIIVFSGISLYAYHADPQFAGDDHRAAARFLAERWRPGDAILVNAGYAYPALLTYWDGDPFVWRGRLVGDEAGRWATAARRGPVLFQTGTVDGDPSLGWADPDSDFYAMSRAETAEALEQLFAEFDRVWVYRIYDTVGDPHGFIRRWLDEHGTQFEDRVFTGESQLRVQGFLTGREDLPGPGQPPDAGLADGSLRLVGSAVLSPTVEVSEALDVALYWQVISPPDAGAILFAGLFDGTGRRWAQADERPLGTLYPPEAWPEGETVRTPLRIQVPPGTPPGSYRLEVGWYRFVDGQPIWLSGTSGERLFLGEVDVVAPEDWWTLPPPEVAWPVDVTMGEGVRLLGWDAPALEGYPGQTLNLDLIWQVQAVRPEGGQVVLQLRTDSGQMLAEASSAPVEGTLPFARLQPGQALLDPRSFPLPGDLAPGVYNLVVGRRRPDGTWLPVRRGHVPLASTYPLATIRVLGRSFQSTPPDVQNRLEARFGDGIGLIGYGLERQVPDLDLILSWRAQAPMTKRYKIFVHLVGGAGPSSILAQADLYPHLPTTAWMPGEYLSDHVVLELPDGLPPGRYNLLVGWYDEATGQRLPVFDGAGKALGDSLPFAQIDLGE